MNNLESVSNINSLNLQDVDYVIIEDNSQVELSVTQKYVYEKTENIDVSVPDKYSQVEVSVTGINGPKETENVDISVPDEKILEEIANVDFSIIAATFNSEEISITFPDSHYIYNGESHFYKETVDKITGNVSFENISTNVYSLASYIYSEYLFTFRYDCEKYT